MGCDIHMVLERRHPETGKWIGLHTFPYLSGAHTRSYAKEAEDGFHVYWVARNRNYALFNAMAGVRGDGSPLGYAPRGLPDDASDLARLHFEVDWSGDGHSESWLTLKEFSYAWHLGQNYDSQDKALAELTASRLEGALEPAVLVGAGVLGVDLESDADVLNYRVVFWFDN